LLKRSRSPNALNRGETSAQGSQGDESSSRRRTLPSSLSSSSSTSWRDFDNMMNEVALARAGPSTYGTTSATWSPLYSPPRGTIGLFEDDRPIPYHNAPPSDFLTEPLDIPIMLRRQDNPRTNFNIEDTILLLSLDPPLHHFYISLQQQVEQEVLLLEAQAEGRITTITWTSLILFMNNEWMKHMVKT
jgi:hypothetical protein